MVVSVAEWAVVLLEFGLVVVSSSYVCHDFNTGLGAEKSRHLAV